jgi:uroporphyrinogen-III synthase
MRLLVTRPEPDGEQTAATLRARGHDVLVASLLRIETLVADLGDGPWAAVAMTSTNAARAVVRHPRLPELTQVPLFVVGRRTAEAARAAGFREVISADGNEQELARLINARCPRTGAPLLYLAGEDRSGDLADNLTADGMLVRTVVVYRAAKASRFPPEAETVIAGGRTDGVLHYSRRSAEAYLGCAEAAGILDRALGLCHYCLSQQVAEPLIGAGAGDVRIASRPEAAALLELI